MICRNCSAEIDENLEKCPVCKKDPTMRDYDKKSGKRGPIIIIFIAACLLTVCIIVGIEISKGQINLPGKNDITTVQSSTPAFAFSDSTTDNTESSSSPVSESKSETPQTSTIEAQTTVSETTAKQTTFTSEPFSLKAPKLVIKKVKDKNKVTVAKYGYIFAQKEQIKSLSQKKFYSFCKNTIGKSKLKWLTIKFEDSTGLVFIGNDYSFASYCRLDKNDFIGTSIGKVILSDGYVYISEKDDLKSTVTTSKPSDKDKTTTPTSDEASKDEPNSETVYITKSGTKYHRSTCSYLTSSKIKINLSEAKQKGYSPCSRCFN